MSFYSSFKPGVTGVATLTAGTDTAVNSATGFVTVWNTSTLQTITNRGSTTSNLINISNTTPSTSTATGALLVQGGIGVGGNITVGGIISASTLTISTNLSASSATFTGIVTDTSGIPSSSTATGAIVITNNGGIGVGGQITAAKAVTTDQTAATTNGAGSVQIGGGAYIANNLVVMSAQSSTGTTTSNALYVAGGVGIGGGLSVAGSTVFKGPIYFSNSATSIVSSNTSYTSNLIELHVPPTGNLWTVDDGRDIGIRFHFYANNTDTEAVLVLANDTKYLEFYGSGAVGSSTFSTATYGTFKTGNILLVSTTNAVSTTTGALQIKGGLAVNLDTWIGGAETINSTLDATTTTGALLVKNGGASIAKSLYVGSNLANLSANTGNAVVIAGGIGVASSSYLGGNVLINSGSLSASINSGQALIVNGGIGAQAVYASQLYDSGTRVITNVIPTAGAGIAISNLSITGTTVVFTVTNIGLNKLQAGPGIALSTTTSATIVTNIGVTSITGTPGQIVASTSTGAVVLSLPFGISFTTSSVNTLYVTGTQPSFSTNTGALQVVGGIGVGSSIYVGSTATINGSIYRQGNAAGSGWSTSTIGIGLSIGPGTYSETAVSGSFGNITAINSFGASTIANTVGTTLYGDVASVYINGAPSAGSNVTITNPWGLIVDHGNVKITSTTPSNSVAGGALVVAGGIGVSGNLISGGTGQFNAGGVLIGNTLINMLTAVTSSTSAQTIDNYSSLNFRTARYLLQAVSGTSVHITEMTLFHNGINVYKDEYGISTNNGELGVFDATLSGGTVSLIFTPNTANVISITAQRTLLGL